MRDHRVDALAQILVRYSTKVKKGDVCSIAATAAAEPLVQAVYEEVLRAGGLPIMQLQTERRAGRVLRAGERRAARLGAAHDRVDRRERRRAHLGDGVAQHARALERGPEEAGPPPEGAQADHGDVDAAGGRGRLPLGAHAVPDARVRERGGHVAVRLRGLLLRGLPRARRRSRDRVAAPVGAGAAAHGVDPGQGGGAHPGRGHRHHARRGRPQLDPVRGRAQHARRRVLHRARSRTR